MKEGNNKITERLLIVALFLVACLIRFWPETRGADWPIGYDTFNAYLPDILKFDGNFWQWISSANLLYFLLWPFYYLFSINPSIIIKVAGPIIYGLLGVTFYLFCRRSLKWSLVMSLFASTLLIWQLPTLRLSWDLFRNMLGLIFFFPAIYLLENNKSVKNVVFLFAISILIVLSHQLVSAVWFIVVLAWIAKEAITKNYRQSLKIALIILPSLLFFWYIATHPVANNFGGQVIYLGDESRVWRYFSVYKNPELRETILSLFWLNFKYILPFAIYGFWLMRRNLVLTVLTIWLLLGTFSSLIFGGVGLFVWDRWMIMLVFPFIIYTVTGLWDLAPKVAKIKFIKAKLKSKVLPYIASGLAIIYIGLFVWQNIPFIIADYEQAKKPFLNEIINSYFPPTMVHNAIGYKNLKSTVSNINFLNKEAPVNAVILVDNRYRGLILTNLDFRNRKIYIYSWSNKFNKKALEDLREKNYGPIYTVWDSQENINGFKRIYYTGLVATYRDKETFKYYLLHLP